MCAWIKVVVLAVVQGVTEFLPISSSGHLVLGKHLLQLDSPSMGLEIALHVGTLLSILFYFRRRLASLAAGALKGQRESLLFALYVILATIPAGLAYFLFDERIEALFDSPRSALLSLGVTGAVLLSTRWAVSGDRQLSAGCAGAMGVGQALALLPGISRSGMTISAARHLGIGPARAAEFSLLMSVPVLIGAPLVQLLRSGGAPMGDVSVPALGVGVAVSALVGYAAIAVLMRSLTKGRFWMFGFYCLGVSAVGLVGMALT